MEAFLVIIKICSKCKRHYKRGAWVRPTDDELYDIVQNSSRIRYHHTLCAQCKKESRE